MVTGPVFGVGVCILVLIIDLLLLGLGRERQYVELTILDNHENKALVAHGVASFGGFRLNQVNLPMGSELFVNDLMNRKGRYYYYENRNRGSLNLQMDGEMKFGTVLRARQTGHYATLQESPERRRVQLFQDADGTFRLENDLGVAMVDIAYIDAEGN